MVSLFAKFGSVLAKTFFVTFASVVAIAVIVRYSLYDAQDPFKCNALLNEGWWLDQAQVSSNSVPKIWQPPGCTIRDYQPRDIQICLQKRRVVFIGDSAVRQVFWSTVAALDHGHSSEGEKHSDYLVQEHGVTLEFIWDPWLNSTRLATELDIFLKKDKKRNPPAILLLGTGLWYSKYMGEDWILHWKASIDSVLRYMRWTNSTVSRPHSDFILLVPVTVPDWNKLSEKNKELITLEEVTLMNDYLATVSNTNGADIAWAFNKLAGDMPQAFDESGIHNVQDIANVKADILLNLRCNSELEKYPLDGTCCNTYKSPNYVQWLTLIGTLFALGAVGVILKDKGTPSAATTPVTVLSRLQWLLPSEKNHAALMAFGLAVVFCFYADRTQVLDKSHKHYLSSEFFGLSILSLALGGFTIRKTTTDPRTAASQPFLGRDQTDEWKGWMQFAILIYHYTGASKVPWVYEFIRLLVASYLFMTGYGHTIYFYKKKDFSLKRIASVLIRLNLLSLALPYMMRTDYLFYYFAPLVSYWFMVVYLTMWTGHKYNANTKFLIGKIVCSAFLAATFTLVPGILETIFWALNATARIDWNVTEWRFRVFLDMWIVYFGMLVAIVYIKFSDANSPITNLSRWPIYQRGSIIASAILLPSFFIYQSSFPDKFKYNAVHPYVSFIPIIAFIILRNATPNLRNTYIGAYSWIGKCSLETFTLQFHMWMAGDTKVLLNYGIRGSGRAGRWLNFIIATVVFLWASNRVAEATGVLTGWIIGSGGGQKSTPRMPRMPVLPTADVELQPLTTGKQNEHTTNSNRWPSGTGDTRTTVLPAEDDRRTRVLLIRIWVWLLAMWFMNLTYY